MPQMVFGILAKRVAGQPPAPRVFWKQFNNGHLLITMTTMSFDGLSFKMPFVIASYFTPQPTLGGAWWRETRILICFIIE